MSKLLAMDLTDKKVMGEDGMELGQLHNITCNIETGELNDLVVEPTSRGRELYESDENGYIRIPTNNLKDVKDYIVIER